MGAILYLVYILFIEYGLTKRRIMIIGVMGAMREEVEPLLKFFKDYEIVKFGGNNFYRAIYKNSTVIIAYSRIGKVHASITATTMILKFNCEKIIFSGVAGGIDSTLKVGDLLIASKLCQHDVDISAFGHALGFIPEGKLFYEADSSLNRVAFECARELELDLKEGAVASGDIFVASKDAKERIKKEFNVMAVEMEGASVACVCDNFNIPFCIFRTISDSADLEASVSFDEFLETSAKISADFVINMIERLVV